MRNGCSKILELTLKHFCSINIFSEMNFLLIYMLLFVFDTGYGHSTPTTAGGKGFCIVYALIGIPLGLVMFQSIGERLNKFSAIIIRNVKRMLKFKDTEASETNLIIVVFTLSFIVTMVGAAAFAKYEGWDYFDSVYYCFVTLTTIGFGDYVALQKDSALQKNPEYVIFSLVFILFGLAVVAACMNLLVLRFMTMNTEDERRDEAEAQAAAQGAVRLEGDVITANGSIISGQGPGGGPLENSSYDDLTSVCSCTCYGYNNRTPKHRYTVSRSPGKLSHLLPMQALTSSDTREDIFSTFNDETNSFLQYQIHRKRASI